MIIDDDDDESNDNQQSDLVRLVLNLAYITEEQAKNFNFDKESYMNIKKGVKGILGGKFGGMLGVGNSIN